MNMTSQIQYVIHRLIVMLAFAMAGVVSSCASEAEMQARFASPDQALAALREAVQAGDTNALLKIFGPAESEIVNPDAIQDANQLRRFAQHLGEFTELATQANQTVIIHLGSKHWPFPIPLVTTNGQWVFDTLAGKEEILNRRIGHDELSAIEVCHAYVQAQREYAVKDYDGNGVMEYARHFNSTPGMKDGLYWQTASSEEPSPFGPLVARAHDEGYDKLDERKRGESEGKCTPFHGYIFRILKRQGKNAPGGKYDYIINGHMVAGFGLMAYPVEWGNSGVMTFIVNQRGKVYQKNLGPKTATLARDIRSYDPDSSWMLVNGE